MSNNWVVIDLPFVHLDDAAAVVAADVIGLLITLLFYNRAHSFVFVVDLFRVRVNKQNLIF